MLQKISGQEKHEFEKNPSNKSSGKFILIKTKKRVKVLSYTKKASCDCEWEDEFNGTEDELLDSDYIN